MSWKSSDGGSISTLGELSYSGTAGGGYDVVTAAANEAGLLLRTALIYSGNVNSHGVILGGSVRILGLETFGSGSPNYVHLERELLIPAGLPLRLHGFAGAPTFYITYDLLG